MSQIKPEEFSKLIVKITTLIGCDEVGYGALAGPLVVCGVRAPKDWRLDGLNDSKKLSAIKRNLMRDKLNKLISNKEITFHLAERTNEEIDKLGVYPVLKNCYVEIFHKLYVPDSLIIVDGNLSFDNLGVDDYNLFSMVKADAAAPTVMAASILAKTYRDGKMQMLHHLYPKFGWNENVGYGSKDHMDLIKRDGPSPLHRMSYAPMKNMLEKK